MVSDKSVWLLHHSTTPLSCCLFSVIRSCFISAMKMDPRLQPRFNVWKACYDSVFLHQSHLKPTFIKPGNGSNILASLSECAVIRHSSSTEETVFSHRLGGRHNRAAPRDHLLYYRGCVYHQGGWSSQQGQDGDHHRSRFVFTSWTSVRRTCARAHNLISSQSVRTRSLTSLSSVMPASCW